MKTLQLNAVCSRAFKLKSNQQFLKLQEIEQFSKSTVKEEAVDYIFVIKIQSTLSTR